MDLTTLALTAVASAAAAYVTSKVWTPGTLASAAFTPVLVALIREALRKPTEVVTSAVPMPGISRRPRERTLPDDLSERYEEGAPVPLPPPEPGAEEGPVRYHSTRSRRLRWRLAVITGLLGFAVCVLIYTVPELLAGKAVSRGGRATTLFGGRHKHKSSTTTTTTITKTVTTTPTTTTQTETTPTTTTAPPTTTTAPPPTTTATTPAQPVPAPTTTQPPAASPGTTTP